MVPGAANVVFSGRTAVVRLQELYFVFCLVVSRSVGVISLSSRLHAEAVCILGVFLYVNSFNFTSCLFAAGGMWRPVSFFLPLPAEVAFMGRLWSSPETSRWFFVLIVLLVSVDCVGKMLDIDETARRHRNSIFLHYFCLAVVDGCDDWCWETKDKTANRPSVPFNTLRDGCVFRLVDAEVLPSRYPFQTHQFPRSGMYVDCICLRLSAVFY